MRSTTRTTAFHSVPRNTNGTSAEVIMLQVHLEQGLGSVPKRTMTATNALDTEPTRIEDLQRDVTKDELLTPTDRAWRKHQWSMG